MKLLEQRIATWAEASQDIRTVVVVGSQARVERPADEWSDLDLVVFTTLPERYLGQIDWIEDIGTVLVTFVQDTPLGAQRERRVLFRDGLDVDFTFVSNSEARSLIRFLRLLKRFPSLRQRLQKKKSQMMKEITDFTSIIRRGIRVIVDKDRMAIHLPLLISGQPFALPPKPSQSEFEAVLNEFWYLAVLTAKKVRRGDLWTAIRINDYSMKSLLLKLLEWQARAVNGWDYDTWHNGSFLHEWGDEHALGLFTNAFACYDADDIGRALTATIDICEQLATEVADLLHLSYLTTKGARVRELVENYLSQSR